MNGHIRRRGARSWELKFDVGRDPATGKRQVRYKTVRGTKKEAEAELRRLLSEVDDGSFVDPSKMTVAQYADHWLKNIAPTKASGKTLERYREIVEKHIKPRLGAVVLQKLHATKIETFYSDLATSGRADGKGGLKPQTVVHIHRLLSQILASAVMAGKLRVSPIKRVQTTPKVDSEEIQVLDDDELAALLRHLKGKSLYMPVLLAASTGMRRGEVLGLRWKDVDFEAHQLTVNQVVEQTREGLRLKAPKTDQSRRTIALPATVVEALKEHRREQAKMRLQLGLGRNDNDLVFTTFDGETRSPRAFTKEFRHHAEHAGVGHITLHGLRHTHISHLLRQGVPVKVVSQRAGHKNATVTLNIYAHVMPGMDESAAALVNETLRKALED